MNGTVPTHRCSTQLIATNAVTIELMVPVATITKTARLFTSNHPGYPEEKGPLTNARFAACRKAGI